MSSYTHNTAPTQFVESEGIRFAFRRFGKQESIPLVFIPHILGNLDSWDPSVTDGLAADREVILFNNAGVASSSGEVPTTFAEMAKSAGVFIDALGLTRVDVLGFSIGSMMQNVALERPDLVRKLVIVGSGPRNGDGIPLTPESQAIFTNKYGNLDDFWIDGFFTASPESLAAGRAFLERRDARVENRDTPIGEKVQPAQIRSSSGVGEPDRRTLRLSAGHQDSRPDRWGEIGHYLLHDQLLLSRAEPSGRTADPLSRRRARLALSVPGFVRRTYGNVPARLTRHHEHRRSALQKQLANP
ncbi:alpha/beta fold hydrolase [Granulicella sibirica]|uniref:alpha/beta fold hydrolase n=1 Tax=Granulicella sibirica TaxID=2479048 RepID=UPI0019D558EE|nr:alpha/beta hydrolase [Granulicella sibirica]